MPKKNSKKSSKKNNSNKKKGKAGAKRGTNFKLKSKKHHAPATNVAPATSHNATTSTTTTASGAKPGATEAVTLLQCSSQSTAKTELFESGQRLHAATGTGKDSEAILPESHPGEFEDERKDSDDDDDENECYGHDELKTNETLCQIKGAMPPGAASGYSRAKPTSHTNCSKNSYAAVAAAPAPAVKAAQVNRDDQRREDDRGATHQLQRPTQSQSATSSSTTTSTSSNATASESGSGKKARKKFRGKRMPLAKQPACQYVPAPSPAKRVVGSGAWDRRVGPLGFCAALAPLPGIPTTAAATNASTSTSTSTSTSSRSNVRNPATNASTSTSSTSSRRSNVRSMVASDNLKGCWARKPVLQTSRNDGAWAPQQGGQQQQQQQQQQPPVWTSLKPDGGTSTRTRPVPAAARGAWAKKLSWNKR